VAKVILKDKAGTHPLSYDLASMLYDTIQHNIKLIDNRPIGFELQIDENLPARLTGDESRTKLILNRLLKNAFMYTSAGKIMMSVVPEPQLTAEHGEDSIMLVFVIRDTGIGMTKKQLDEVFDDKLSYTPDSSIGAASMATGLVAVKRAARQMGGKVNALSEPGKGSQFIVRLPQKPACSELIGSEAVMDLRLSFERQIPRSIKAAQVNAPVSYPVSYNKSSGQEIPAQSKSHGGNIPQTGALLPDGMITDGTIPDATIPGLDIKSGLARYGGNEKTYLRVLHTFSGTMRKSIKALETVTKENLHDYRVVVHGVKGSCHELYATGLGDDAGALENAAKSNDIDFIHSRNPAFLRSAYELLDRIDKMLSGVDTAAPKPQREKPERNVLEALLTACKLYDMDGVEAAMDEISSYSYTADYDLAEELRVYADLMDYMKIIDRLNTELS